MTSPALPSLRERLFGGLSHPVTLALGVTQTIGYGTVFYAYGILAPHITAEFNVSAEWFFAAFSAGLLLGGLVAPMAGRLLDLHGARLVLPLGSVAAAAGLLASSLAPNIWSFVACLIFLEAAACFIFYEAAFAGLTQIHGQAARRHITGVTLIAGFASTIFWPFTIWLEGLLGWRGCFAVFAGLNLFICAPLHWRMLHQARPRRTANDAPRPKAEAAPAAPAEAAILTGETRHRAFILYAAAMVISGLVYSTFPIHFVAIISNEGFSTATAGLIATAMGPTQVLARMLDVAFGQRFDALATGKVALVLLVLCGLPLLLTQQFLPGALAFAACYGASQGLITIARGTVPLQLFGIEGYATLVGKVTGLRFMVNAASPFAFAFIAARWGTELAVFACLVAAALSLMAFLAMARLARRGS